MLKSMKPSFLLLRKGYTCAIKTSENSRKTFVGVITLALRQEEARAARKWPRRIQIWTR
jgi:hypothetical protein